MVALKSKRSAPVPGPRGWPVLGCLPYVASDILGFFSSTTHNYKPVASFNSGGIRCYMVSDPEHIGALYQQDTKKYYKGHLHQVLQSAIGRGVVISNGELWAQQRALMQPLFTKQRVGQWFPEIYRETLQLIQSWESNRNHQVELVEAFYGLFQRISLPILFGRQAGNESSDKILKTLDTLADSLLTQIIREPVFGGAINRLPLPGNVRYRRAVGVLHEIIDDLIIASSEADTDDHCVMASLLRAQASGHATQLTSAQIRDELITLFIASIDTTALALAWTLHFLAGDRVADERVASEATAIDWSSFQPRDTHELRYTRCAIDEAMRLMPPAYFVSRNAVADQTLLDTPIERDGLVILCQYAMHRHPEYWPSPTTFDPRRFESKQAQSSPRYAFFPFGGGPRACLGIHLAQFELQVALAMICTRFRVRLAPGFRAQLRPHLSLQPKHGIPVTLEPR